MSIDITIKYCVVPYCGTAYIFDKKGEATKKYREERKSDPTVSLVKITKVHSTDTEVLL
jgi:hypothetical protein